MSIKYAEYDVYVVRPLRLGMILNVEYWTIKTEVWLSVLAKDWTQNSH